MSGNWLARLGITTVMLGQGTLRGDLVAIGSRSPLLCFFFVRLHISMEGCYRCVLILGILVSRHVGRRSPDAFKIRKKTSPSMVEGAAECSLTLQGGAEL